MGEEGGDGAAEGSSARGDGGQAARSLTPDVDGSLLEHKLHVCIFESSKLEGSYVGGSSSFLLYSILSYPVLSCSPLSFPT